MRIAFVSPYSWSYPGGVTRHIEALAERFIEDGHDVRVLAPFDPADRLSTRAASRRRAAGRSSAPDYLVPLGRTIGFRPTAPSRTCRSPRTASRPCRRSCAPAATTSSTCTSRSRPAGWIDADWTRLPLVGTFHAYSESRLSNGIANVLGARRVLNRLHVRIAVSEAAAWTARRFFGGRYRDHPQRRARRPASAPRCAAARPTGDRCGSCSSARRSSARACRCCCARSRRCASTSRPS